MIEDNPHYEDLFRWELTMYALGREESRATQVRISHNTEVVKIYEKISYVANGLVAITIES